MSINEDVQKAIEKNLSAEVASNLKDFIAEAELNKTLLKDTKKELKEVTEKYNHIYNLNRNYDDVNTRNTALQSEEKALETKEEILKVKTECQNMRVEEIRGLVQTVFQSNRLNYNLSLGYSEYNSQSGSQDTKHIDGSITQDT